MKTLLLIIGLSLLSSCGEQQKISLDGVDTNTITICRGDSTVQCDSICVDTLK